MLTTFKIQIPTDSTFIQLDCKLAHFISMLVKQHAGMIGGDAACSMCRLTPLPVAYICETHSRRKDCLISTLVLLFYFQTLYNKLFVKLIVPVLSSLFYTPKLFNTVTQIIDLTELLKLYKKSSMPASKYVCSMQPGKCCQRSTKTEYSRQGRWWCQHNTAVAYMMCIVSEVQSYKQSRSLTAMFTSTFLPPTCTAPLSTHMTLLPLTYPSSGHTGLSNYIQRQTYKTESTFIL